MGEGVRAGRHPCYDGRVSQADLTTKRDELRARGVTLVDPGQVYIAPDVEPSRVYAGAVLHPGTRLHGAATFVGPDAHVGLEGPATLVNAVLDRGCVVASGYVEGATLLAGARLGSAAHVRPGTLLEEEASTGHAVGLKHTILMPFATLGSLINFCDVLLAGGTSRRDHSEVGSGFIHFNFTPQGDKATPTRCGDVPRGVLLRSPRVFLGGEGGIVGPRSVGFGAVTGAGWVVREDIAPQRLVARPLQAIDREVSCATAASPRKVAANVRYIAELVALRHWYRYVRLPRARHDEVQRLVVEAALGVLHAAIEERRLKLAQYCAQVAAPAPTLAIAYEDSGVPIGIDANVQVAHVTWVQSLTAQEADALHAWLERVVATVAASAAVDVP